jgi:hypothetical protein
MIHLELFADYFQFYIQDESADGHLGDAWTSEAVDRLLAIAPGTVGVGTVRNMLVPVDIETLDREPALDLTHWDQVVQCEIEVSSGRLVVAGCTDYFPDALRIDVAPGKYVLRVCYQNLHAVSADGLNGNDVYRLQLWPGACANVMVLKSRAT